MNPHIEKALEHLKTADYAGYFEEMDKVQIPDQLLPLYNTNKRKYIDGKVPWDFSQILETLAKNIDTDNLSTEAPNPQNNTYNITINNEGGKIGQINHGGTVDNKGANFNL